MEYAIQDHPDFKDITMWSDSCVSQNRNLFIAYTTVTLLVKYEHLNSTTVKYSVPGHTCIQSVDNMHSIIGKATTAAEFFSLVSLLRVMKKSHTCKPYKIKQIKQSLVLQLRISHSNMYPSLELRQ